jgi:hypothetical protein
MLEIRNNIFLSEGIASVHAFSGEQDLQVQRKEMEQQWGR